MSERNSRSRANIFGYGFFIGIVCGISLALLAAWAVDRNSLRELFLGNAMSRGETTASPSESPGDLYGVLPEGNNITRVPTPAGVAAPRPPASAVVAVPDSPNAPPVTAPSVTPAPMPLIAPATPQVTPEQASAAEAKPSRWLQVGSFTKSEDAENRRVELALSGWEATIQKTDVPNVGVRYRVRIGPFTDDAILARIKTEVERRNFATAVVQQ